MDDQDDIDTSKALKEISSFSKDEIMNYQEFIKHFGQEDLTDLIYIFKLLLSDFRLLKSEGKELRPFQSIRGDSNKDVFMEQQEAFINRYRITKMDKLLIAKIIEGIPLKSFEDKIGISASNANKKIRRLWHRLGLKNREQLIFVAGWMRLISFELQCLQCERPNNKFGQ
ncbi:hypothetical protein ACFL03_15315 [Thermodesulfobacteriota bacterium]